MIRLSRSRICFSRPSIRLRISVVAVRIR